MKNHSLLVLVLLSLLIFPLSSVFSQGHGQGQGQGLGTKSVSNLEGVLLVNIHECDCTDCDHVEEEEENYSYHLQTAGGTFYDLHLGPKWWRQDNLNHALFKNEVRVGVNGVLTSANRLMVFEILFPTDRVIIRGESGPPPWGGQGGERGQMDDGWMEEDFGTI